MHRSDRVRLAGACCAALLAIAALPAAAQDASEPCDIDLRVDQTVQWRGPHGRGYEVLSDAPAFEPLRVSILHRGSACRFYLTATPARSSDPVLVGPTNVLVYDLLTDPNGPSVLTPEYFGTTASQIHGEFTGEPIQELVFYVAIPSGQFVGQGVYRGQAALRAFRVDPEGPVLLAEVPIPVQVAVASTLQVRSDSFGPDRRSMAIDLGALDREHLETMEFQVLTNAAVTMRLESVHGGMLAHDAGAPGLPYEVSLAGERLRLQQPAMHRITSVDSQHQSIPFQIIVTPPDGLLAAGSYRDLLTITFTTD
ncbi:hypothetical protein RM533_05360 [Croceicoccus sp. F390]|uniref:Spore coat protein U domain-containing protein n=1 Tax=Croceicoccus esteveae TaxID=3075597 RepID=A0ABU2ZG83_9SPHN|nr:hypothetical protein [Croceicoccus sp. F390]MDT0575606.1 hypothetical protein [Croceicoccus sp. F390]